MLDKYSKYNADISGPTLTHFLKQIITEAHILIAFDIVLYGLGSKLRYMGYFSSLLLPREGKLGYYFQGNVLGLRKLCFIKFSVVNFL